MKRVVRAKEGMIAGVCAGIAQYFGIDPTIVRIGWVLVSLFTGGFLGLIAYIVCAFISPLEDDIID